MAASQNPRIVVGVFDEESQAKSAVDTLRDANFDRDQVGVAMREAGIVTPTLADDFRNLGVPEDRASFYEDEFKSGHVIVSVRPDGREEEAKRILRSNGGYDYETSGTSASTRTKERAGTYTQTTDQERSGRYTQAGRSNQNTDYDQTSTYNQASDYGQGTSYNQTNEYAQGATYNRAADRDVDESEEDRTLRLREERLQAEKQRVQTGEARIHKDVISEEKSINVPVTHEEVVIEQRPVSGEQVSDTPIGEDETIRVPVSEEQVNVTKNAVVTGEVSIGKRGVQEQKQYTDTVRREEARLERQGDVNVQGNTDADLDRGQP